MELNPFQNTDLALYTLLIILSVSIQSSVQTKVYDAEAANVEASSPIPATPASLFPKKSKSKWRQPTMTKVNITKVPLQHPKNPLPSNVVGKSDNPKQSWLAVASAVAHSTAASSENPQQIPNDDSKPTKYHYYPHNQHLYLLPECATQQVCSAVYLRLNYSQPLCACPPTHRPCSVSTRTDDRHTIPLVTGSQSQILTLVKTCERTQEVRECRAPKDWSILALQNSRTGKAHYLVICRCPAPGFLEGPIAHSQPAYARVPGIRVYGMACVTSLPKRGGRAAISSQAKVSSEKPSFPWYKLKTLFEQSFLN